MLYVIYSKVTKTLEQADTRELRMEADKIMGQVSLDPLVIPLPPSKYSIRLQHYYNFSYEEIFTSPDFPVLSEELFLLDSYEIDTLKIVNLSQKVSESGTIILSLARSNTRLLDEVRNVKLYLITASILAIMVAGFLVFIAAGFMLRPFQKIIGVAGRINASNSIERVPVPDARDESRQLAETLNDMLSRIELSIKNQINFFASATHELKTPLAVMQTELTVSLGNTNDGQIKKILESQLMEVQRLDRIIHDFLLMSQLKGESLSIRKTEQRLEEVIYEAVKKVRYLSIERGTQIQINLMDEQTHTSQSLDFDKIQTVFINLIENAIKYSPHQSVIRINIMRDAVSIVNKTINPVTNIQSLTSEFNKSEELSSGLGMGLWLCNQIIILHEAELKLSYNDSEFSATILFGTR